MPKVYGAGPSPFVRKVLVVLAEKGIEYEHDPIMPFGVSAEYKKISPLGKIPAFQDGDKTLADSSVICAYLERIHPEPALYPSDPYEYARALWFEEFGDGGLTPVTGAKIFFARIVGPLFMNQPCDETAVQKAVDEDLPPLFDYLESQLTGDFLVGKSLTIGDIGVATHFVNLAHAGVSVDGTRWPRLAKFVDRMHARPSFAKLIQAERALFGGAAASA